MWLLILLTSITIKYNYKFIFVILLFIFLCFNGNDKLRVCLCTIGKEENKYVLEFVSHYKKYNMDKIIYFIQ